MNALVAIVGKTNVGKSTLFNRIAGKRKAIESEMMGTTRDPIFAKVKSDDLDFNLVDTSGLMFSAKVDLERELELEAQEQSKVALKSADLILFCVNGKEDLTQDDFEVVKLIKRSTAQKPVFLVINKVDRPLKPQELAEYLQLGFASAEIIVTSAFHNFGISELLTKIRASLASLGFKKETIQDLDQNLSIAIIGRPNVGKSSLINSFLKEKKLLVSDLPGTTRDSIDSEINFNGEQIELIDTAGLRRRKKREDSIEHYSYLRTLNAIERCDVGVVLIDSTEGVTHQDQVIMQELLRSRKGVIIAVSKWDEDDQGRFALETSVGEEKGEVKEQARSHFVAHLRSKFAFTPWALVVFVSAREQKNLTKIFELAQEIKKNRETKIATSILNQFLQEIFIKSPIRSKGRVSSKIKFATQVDISPPHFLFFANDPDSIHFSSRRYLENRLRETFGFLGTSIVLEFRDKNSKTLKKYSST